MLGVPFAPEWWLERSILACLTTLGKQSCGIERQRVKNCDYNRAPIDVKGKLATATKILSADNTDFVQIRVMSGKISPQKVIDRNGLFLLHCATKAFHPTTSPQLDSENVHLCFSD